MCVIDDNMICLRTLLNTEQTQKSEMPKLRYAQTKQFCVVLLSNFIKINLDLFSCAFKAFRPEYTIIHVYIKELWCDQLARVLQTRLDLWCGNESNGLFFLSPNILQFTLRCHVIPVNELEIYKVFNSQLMPGIFSFQCPLHAQYISGTVLL